MSGQWDELQLRPEGSSFVFAVLWHGRSYYVYQPGLSPPVVGVRLWVVDVLYWGHQGYWFFFRNPVSLLEVGSSLPVNLHGITVDGIHNGPGHRFGIVQSRCKAITPEGVVVVYPLVEEVGSDVVMGKGSSTGQSQSPYIWCWFNNNVGVIVLWGQKSQVGAVGLPLSSFGFWCKKKVGILLSNMAGIWKDNWASSVVRSNMLKSHLCFLWFAIAGSETEHKRNALLALLNLSALCARLFSKTVLSELLIANLDFF